MIPTPVNNYDISITSVYSETYKQRSRTRSLKFYPLFKEDSARTIGNENIVYYIYITTYYTISISVKMLPLSARNTRLVLDYTSQNETGLHFRNRHQRTGGQTQICLSHRETFVSRVIE